MGADGLWWTWAAPEDVRRRVEGSFMCAPIDGRNGPGGAHPWMTDTARTLAGSVRYCQIHYTGISNLKYLPGKGGAASVYLIPHAFLSPAAISASGPHQSTSLEGQ